MFEKIFGDANAAVETMKQPRDRTCTTLIDNDGNWLPGPIECTERDNTTLASFIQEQIGVILDLSIFFGALLLVWLLAVAVAHAAFLVLEKRENRRRNPWKKVSGEANKLPLNADKTTEA